MYGASYVGFPQLLLSFLLMVILPSLVAASLDRLSMPAQHTWSDSAHVTAASASASRASHAPGAWHRRRLRLWAGAGPHALHAAEMQQQLVLSSDSCATDVMSYGSSSKTSSSALSNSPRWRAPAGTPSLSPLSSTTPRSSQSDPPSPQPSPPLSQASVLTSAAHSQPTASMQASILDQQVGSVGHQNWEGAAEGCPLGTHESRICDVGKGGGYATDQSFATLAADHNQPTTAVSALAAGPCATACPVLVSPFASLASAKDADLPLPGRNSCASAGQSHPVSHEAAVQGTGAATSPSALSSSLSYQPNTHMSLMSIKVRDVLRSAL